MKNLIIKDINCKDWHNFQKKLDNLSINLSEFIFRGQYNSDWPLNTSFQRFINKIGITIYVDSEDPFHLLLNLYKPHFDRKFKGNKFILDDYISLGQHHELPTTYQDWTKTINKAIFFAFCDEIINPQNHDFVAIFALRVENIENLVDELPMKEFIRKKHGFKLFEESGIYLIEPDHKLPNNRIDSQDGVFIKIDGSRNQNIDLIQILNNIYSCYNIARPIIYKFIIPRIEAMKVLKELHIKSSINFATIYPDKEGFAKQAKFEFIMTYPSTNGGAS